MVVHDNPLYNAGDSFRKAMRYALTHTRMLRMLYGNEFQGLNHVDFPISSLIGDLTLVNGVRAYKYHRRRMLAMGSNIGMLRFLQLKAVYELGRLTGMVRGVLGLS